MHPAAWLALVLLVANDHWWKWSHPGVLTGKLSDVAGLVLFPLLLQAMGELALATLGHPWRPSRSLLVATALLTGVVFTLVQTSALAGDAYRYGLAVLQWPARGLAAVAGGASPPALRPVHLVQDASDLLVLPAIGIALLAGWRRSS
jgi:hypothetical protein